MKESILKRFPDLNPNDFVLRDDGNGIYIDIWNSSEKKPTMAQVMQWINDDSNIIEKTEIDILKEELALSRAENAQMNLAIIDLWEMII